MFRHRQSPLQEKSLESICGPITDKLGGRTVSSNQCWAYSGIQIHVPTYTAGRPLAKSPNQRPVPIWTASSSRTAVNSRVPTPSSIFLLHCWKNKSDPCSTDVSGCFIFVCWVCFKFKLWLLPVRQRHSEESRHRRIKNDSSGTRISKSDGESVNTLYKLTVTT